MINSSKKNLKILHDKSSVHDRPLVELSQNQNNKFVISMRIANSSFTFPELQNEDIVALHRVLSLPSGLMTIAVSMMHNLSEDKLKETVKALDQIADR